jgi:molecular chaperone GrpE (heat shock protein)
MKIGKVAVAAVSAVCVLAFMDTPRAFAHAGHSHGAANVVIPETAEEIMAEINKNHAEITAAVTGKKLKAVHDLAETMTALAKALPEKVAEDKKARVQSTTDNMIKLLDTLHHAADDGDQPRSGIELKKLDGAVNSLTNQLK